MGPTLALQSGKEDIRVIERDLTMKEKAGETRGMRKA